MVGSLPAAGTSRFALKPLSGALLLAALASTGQAATITVATTSDTSGCTLRSAVLAVQQASTSTPVPTGCTASGPAFGTNDTINITATGTMTLDSLSGTIGLLDKSVTISGPGQSQLTIDLNGIAPGLAFAMSISPPPAWSIGGLTLTNGAGQAILAANIDPTAGTPSLLVSNVSVTGNSGTGDFIYSYGVDTTINDSTIAGNTSVLGAGVTSISPFLTPTSLTIQRSTIADNNVSCACTSGAAGGGVYAYGSTVTIADSTISGNVVTSTAPNGFARGGGIYANYATLSITNSTISGNRAVSASNGDAAGGGVFAVVYNMTIANSTIAFNQLQTDSPGLVGGAGVFAYVYSSDSPSSITNTVIAGNTTTLGSAPSSGDDYLGPGDPSVTFSYDLIQTPNSLAGTIPLPTNILGQPASLGPLSNNGGPTKTHALLPGSLAINTGDPAYPGPLVNDQRGPGFARVKQGRLDIGAFEADPFAVGNVSIPTLDNYALAALSGLTGLAALATLRRRKRRS